MQWHVFSSRGSQRANAVERRSTGWSWRDAGFTFGLLATQKGSIVQLLRCIIPIMDNGNMSSYYQAVSDHTIAFTSPGRMLRASEECDKQPGWWKIKNIMCTFQQQHRSPSQIKSKSRKWHKWGCKVRGGRGGSCAGAGGSLYSWQAVSTLLHNI